MTHIVERNARGTTTANFSTHTHLIALTRRTTVPSAARAARHPLLSMAAAMAATMVTWTARWRRTEARPILMMAPPRVTAPVRITAAMMHTIPLHRTAHTTTVAAPARITAAMMHTIPLHRTARTTAAITRPVMTHIVERNARGTTTANFSTHTHLIALTRRTTVPSAARAARHPLLSMVAAMAATMVTWTARWRRTEARPILMMA